MPGGIAQRPVVPQRQLEQMCPQKDRLLRGGEHFELAADTELERELANDLVAEGVKRSDRDIALTERRQQVDALLHLRRRALGERDGEDLLWARAARRDQVGDAASEHAGLARPRARHDEER